jgi:hypothetical protein
MNQRYEQTSRDASHSMLCILVATIALFAVLVTHGLMADDAMHMENTAECLATVSSISPATICAPIVPPAILQVVRSSASIYVSLEDQTPPAPTGAYARHGPSDLQVFRT